MQLDSDSSSIGNIIAFAIMRYFQQLAIFNIAAFSFASSQHCNIAQLYSGIPGRVTGNKVFCLVSLIRGKLVILMTTYQIFIIS